MDEAEEPIRDIVDEGKRLGLVSDDYKWSHEEFITAFNHIDDDGSGHLDAKEIEELLVEVLTKFVSAWPGSLF